MGLLLLIILILLLVGGLPHWNYSRSWGYAPSGTLVHLLVVVVALLALGYGAHVVLNKPVANEDMQLDNTGQWASPTVNSGSDVFSMKVCSSSLASDHQVPLPPITIGRSAWSSRSMRRLTSVESGPGLRTSIGPSGRG